MRVMNLMEQPQPAPEPGPPVQEQARQPAPTLPAATTDWARPKASPEPEQAQPEQQAQQQVLAPPRHTELVSASHLLAPAEGVVLTLQSARAQGLPPLARAEPRVMVRLFLQGS